MKTEYSEAWDLFIQSPEYQSGSGRMEAAGIKQPYADNVLRVAFDAAWNTERTQSAGLPSEGKDIVNNFHVETGLPMSIDDKDMLIQFYNFLRTRLAGGKEDGWISCSERLPDHNHNLLTTDGKFCSVSFHTKGHEIEYEDYDYEGEYDPIEDANGTLYLKNGWYETIETSGGDYDFIHKPKNVTHWRELPAPPNEQKS